MFHSDDMSHGCMITHTVPSMSRSGVDFDLFRGDKVTILSLLTTLLASLLRTVVTSSVDSKGQKKQANEQTGSPFPTGHKTSENSK